MSNVETTAKKPQTKNVVDSMKKKKKRNKYLWIGIGVVLLVIIGMVIINSGKEKAIYVQTEKAAKRTITEVVQATGKVQPETQVKVAPEVPGEIVQLPVAEGMHVSKGQLLAKIQPTSFVAQYDAAKAQLSATKASSEQTRAQRIQADLALKRAKELHQKGITSAAELEQVQAQFDIADANYNSARYSVTASESQLRQFAESLRKTTVEAPMEGVVTQLISQLGEKVVGTSQFSGTEMMTISDLAVMNAEVDVDENDVVNIKVGDTARVTIDAFPNRTFVGTVIEVANSAKLKGVGTQDQSTNFAVKIRLAGFEEGELRPGMSCTAKIETETKRDILTVPIMAVTRRATDKVTAPAEKQQSDGAEEISEAAKTAKQTEKKDESPTVVFIVQNGRAKMIPVKMGISDNAYVEITQGISGGEEIIKGNYAAVSKDLKDNSLVRVDKNTSGAASAPKAEKK